MKGVRNLPKVPEHHSSGQDHSSRVGDTASLNVLSDVSATLLEESNIPSDVGSRNNSRSSDKGSSDVGNDVSVKVGHDHDVELVRLGDKLHGAD